MRKTDKMDIVQLPFNRLIGLAPGSGEDGFLISLPDDHKYTNHLGTVHGSALLAVAEAGSGAFLAKAFGDSAGFIPVVRRLEARFRKPARGRVSARCLIGADEVDKWARSLSTQGRVSASVPVDVVDDSGVVVLSAVVEWFIAKGKTEDT